MDAAPIAVDAPDAALADPEMMPDAGAIEELPQDDSDYMPTGEEEEVEEAAEGDEAAADANADADAPPPPTTPGAAPAGVATARPSATAAAPPPPPRVVLLRPPDLSTIVTPPEMALFAAAVAEKSAAAAMAPSPPSTPPGGGGDDHGGAQEGEQGRNGGEEEDNGAIPAAAAPPAAPSLEELQARAASLLRPPPHRPYLAGVPRDDGTGALDVYAVLPGQRPPVGATLLLEVAAQRPGAAPPPVRRYQRQMFAQVVAMHAQLEQHGRDMDVAQRAVAACGVAAAAGAPRGNGWGTQGGGGGGGGGAASASAAAAAGGSNANNSHHQPGTRGPPPGVLRRDPAAPKRAMTAYLAFAVRQRAAIVDEATAGGLRPVPPPTEVMRLLGERWRTATAEEREACERMAQEDRLRYERERAAYTGPLTMRVGGGGGSAGRGGGGGGGGGGAGAAAGGHDQDLVEAAMAPFRQALMMGSGGGGGGGGGGAAAGQQEGGGGDAGGGVGPNGGKLKGPRDRGAPPLPRSAYLLFVTDYRKNLERGVPFGEATRRAAEAWRGASADERAPFEAEAARDQARFGEDMRRYREGTYVAGGGGFGAPEEMES